MDPFYRIKGTGLYSALSRFYLFFLINLRNECNDHNNSKSGMFLISLKRISILCLLFWTLPAVIIWNHLGFLLDDIFYSKWKDETVDSPLFIIGNARSGTTWVHRVLSKCRHEVGDIDQSELMDILTDFEAEGAKSRTEDLQNDKSAKHTGSPDNRSHYSSASYVTFTSMKTWEIIFAPSVTWRRLFQWIYWFDGLFLFGVLYRFILKQDRKYFADITIHPIGLMEPEEDEWVMAHICLSQLIMFFFPLGGSVLNPIVSFDNMTSSDPTALLPSHTKDDIFIFYRKMIQKHLYEHRTRHRSIDNKTSKRNCNKKLVFLSKNPPFTMRLESLKRYFPNMRVLCMVRDPLQSVPSMVSYINIAWRCFATTRRPDQYPRVDDLLHFCIEHYSYPLNFLNRNSKVTRNLKACSPKRSKITDRESMSYIDDTQQCSNNSNPIKMKFVSYKSFKEDLRATIESLMIDFYGDSISQAYDERFVSSYLAKQQKIANTYRNNHIHSVPQCCGMSEAQLKEKLVTVYDALPDLLR